MQNLIATCRLLCLNKIYVDTSFLNDLMSLFFFLIPKIHFFPKFYPNK